MSRLETTKDLPNISRDETLIVDVETTSFDDKQEAFKPFNGHRICGVAISNLDASKQWYLPLRHNSGISGDKNFTFEQGVQWLRDTLGTGRDIINHNVKFDARFLYQDDVHFNGKMIDTMVLARLVHNYLGKKAYSLDSLGHRFLGEKKDDAVKAYCKSIKTKDYGRTPINLMTTYAERDVWLTAKLYHKLMSLLPDISKDIWDVEQRLTQWIYQAELHGISVDWRKLKTTYASAMQEMLDLSKEIFKIVGHEFDLGSEKEITKVLMGELGIVPKAFTPTGRPQWNQMAFDTMDHPIGKLLGRFSSIEHFTGTYCEGWINREADDGKLHTDIRQSGTKTGRWSATNPNMQNMPPEAEVHVIAEEGKVLLAFDYSQMEYRIFGHYTKSPNILGAYEKDPYMDFHGHLAGMLGVDRQFAKQMNFSFIYGMGRDKLITNIAGLLAIKGEDEEMRKQMRTYLTGGGGATADRAKQLNTQETKELANKIYRDYHLKFPEIRDFQKKVEVAVRQRGWIKNYFGRRYMFGGNAPRHKAVNYIIQGSAADCCKDRILAIHEELASKWPDVHFILQVHDSVILEVPEDQYEDYILDVIPVLESSDFRVPMLVDTKVSDKYMAQAVEVKERLEQVGPDKYRKLLRKAREASKTAKTRGWAT